MASIKGILALAGLAGAFLVVRGPRVATRTGMLSPDELPPPDPEGSVLEHLTAPLAETSAMIAERTKIDRMTVSKALASLRKQGLVEYGRGSSWQATSSARRREE